MKLYSYYRSTSSWRVRIVLAYKKIDYEYRAVNLAPQVREQATAGFDDVNPFRQVPTLEWTHAGRLERLTQSVAIAEYLEELQPAPPLLPRDPMARARVRQMVELVTSGIQPLQNTGTLREVARLTSDRDAEAWAKTAIERGLSALEVFAVRHSGKHAVGDSITLADVFLVPQVYNGRRFGVDLSPFPTLVGLSERASTLDAFVSAHPDRQPDSPSSET